jgi:PAP2 superfamily
VSSMTGGYNLHRLLPLLKGGVAALLMLAAQPANASDGVETAGEVLRIALPLAAGGYSLYQKDYDGVLQLGVSEAIAVGTSFLLQQFIREERPDKSDFRAFPSDSTAMAFSAASYLQIRYGRQFGIPAFAIATFVGYSRVEADKHNWGDVAAGAVLGWLASEITTVRFQNMRISASAGWGGTPSGLFVRLTM